MFQVRLMMKSFVTMCLCASASTAYATAELEATASAPVTAIWKVHRIEFNYRSSSVFYSCDGLRSKIAGIMRAVGAREGLSVDVRCRPGSLTNFATSHITLATPIEATPENVTAATTYSTETQLAARLNKVQLPTANDIDRFPAELRTVELNRVRGLNLESGDCDLLRGLIKQVFPHLSLQVRKQRLSCASGVRLRPAVHVAALMPAPVESLAFAPAPK